MKEELQSKVRKSAIPQFYQHTICQLILQNLRIMQTEWSPQKVREYSGISSNLFLFFWRLEAGYKPVFDLKTKQNKKTFRSRKMYVKFYI